MRHRARLSIAAVAALLLPSFGCYGDQPPAAEAVEGPVTLGLFDDRTSTLPDAAKRGMRSMEARAADFDSDGDRGWRPAPHPAPVRPNPCPKDSITVNLSA
jgi:hypothetical protein